MSAFSLSDLRHSEPGGGLDRPSLERPSQEAARIAPQAERLAEIAAQLEPSATYSPVVLAGAARILEFILVLSCGFGVLEISGPPSAEHLIAIPAIAVNVICVFEAMGLYRTNSLRTPLQNSFRLLFGWSLVFIGAAALALIALNVDRAFWSLWLASWHVAGIGALGIERVALAAFTSALTARGKLERRTVLVGGGRAAEPVLRELGSQADHDLRILGLFDDRTDERSPDVVSGYPRLGTVDDLVEFARHTRLDLIIFTLPISAETRLLQMLRKLWVLPLDIRLAAHANRLRFRPRSYSYIGTMPVIDVFDKPLADWDVVIKAAFDRLVGMIFLILASPLMALIALMVKLESRGPILFKQIRYGFNNEKIEVYKFRSMYSDRLDPLAKTLVTRDDPRVTRVGRFIRKTSLDELPQLLNVVFKGNLSLVGPRPHAMHASAAERLYDEVVDGYFARHRVKPGITGWAQVNGWRGETDTPEKIQKRVEHDLYYIENWSILFDAYILALTPFALLSGKNAY